MGEKQAKEDLERKISLDAGKRWIKQEAEKISEYD